MTDIVQDTPLEVIQNYPKMKVDGLYYIDNDGKKATPHNIYFGCDCRLAHNDETEVHGRAYEAGGYCLSPIFLPDGTRFRNADLCNVSARYKDGVISGYYRE